MPGMSFLWEIYKSASAYHRAFAAWFLSSGDYE